MSVKRKLQDVELEEYDGEEYPWRKQTKSERKLQEEAARKESAMKSIRYLLDHSENYARKFGDKLDQTKDNKLEENFTNGEITPTMTYFTGKLRPYQIEGVKWLKILQNNGISGILADEMGLGKTIQVVALFCTVYAENRKGPNLIMCPLSTLPHWKNEFQRFAPKLPIIIYHGTNNERKTAIKRMNKLYKLDGKPVYPIIISPYHHITEDATAFRRIPWNYIVVDEGQRIKNNSSVLTHILRNCESRNRLLLTGTPVQNNIRELWALLYFLMPHLFKQKDSLSTLLDTEEFNDNDELIKKEKETNIITKIHKVIEPFILRRLKCDVLDIFLPKKEVLVYCPLSSLQKKLYIYTIDKRIELNANKTDQIDITLKKEDRKCRSTVKKYADFLNTNSNVDLVQTRKQSTKSDPLESFYMAINCKILGTWMQLKKIVNHPYLIHFPTSAFGKTYKKELLQQSGKLLVLDAMLRKLKKENHKVLIYSTFVVLLDVLEEYLEISKYQYRRLDGTTSLEDRDIAITEFNNDANIFVFLLSTRAGGLGINLTGADTVIFYDRDWNPQVDIQAQDRCHRIGQTKPVMIFTLVTKNTIDETILKRGENKKKLEKTLIKKDMFNSIKPKFHANTDDYTILVELRQMLEEDKVVKVHSNKLFYSDKELDALLDRRDLYKQMEEKSASLND